MCQRVLLVVLWLLIGTRLRLIAAGILRTAEPCAPLGVSFKRSYSDPVFDGVGLEGFKRRANIFLSITVFFFFFVPLVGCVMLGLRIDRVLSLSPDLALLTLF